MKWLPLLFGCLPFFLGRLLDWSLWTIFYQTGFPVPFWVVCAVSLFLWGLLAWCVCRCSGGRWLGLILLNLPAFVTLLLLGIQEVILHAYWMNAAGIWTQMFYLPFIGVGFVLTSWSSSVFSAYCASFLLMVFFSALGYLIRRRGIF